MMVDDNDRSVANGRLKEAILLSEHFETKNGLKMDTRKTEALWLTTSKSTVGVLDFDTMVVEAGPDDR